MGLSEFIPNWPLWADLDKTPLPDFHCLSIRGGGGSASHDVWVKPGKKPAIFIIPGSPWGFFRWRNVLELWANDPVLGEHMIVLWDRPGIGDSVDFKADTRAYTYGDLAEEVDALTEELGLERHQYLIVGHSIGCLIALECKARGYGCAQLLIEPAHIDYLVDDRFLINGRDGAWAGTFREFTERGDTPDWYLSRSIDYLTSGKQLRENFYPPLPALAVVRDEAGRFNEKPPEWEEEFDDTRILTLDGAGLLVIQKESNKDKESEEEGISHHWMHMPKADTQYVVDRKGRPQHGHPRFFITRLRGLIQTVSRQQDMIRAGTLAPDRHLAYIPRTNEKIVNLQPYLRRCERGPAGQLLLRPSETQIPNIRMHPVAAEQVALIRRRGGNPDAPPRQRILNGSRDKSGALPRFSPDLDSWFPSPRR